MGNVQATRIWVSPQNHKFFPARDQWAQSSPRAMHFEPTLWSHCATFVDPDLTDLGLHETDSEVTRSNLHRKGLSREFGTNSLNSWFQCFSLLRVQTIHFTGLLISNKTSILAHQDQHAAHQATSPTASKNTAEYMPPGLAHRHAGLEPHQDPRGKAVTPE